MLKIKPTDLLEYAALRGLLGLFSVLPLSWASAFGGALGSFVGTLPASLNRTARANLRRVYPDWPAQKIVATQIAALAQLFRTAAEFPAVYSMSANRFRTHYTITGIEHLQDCPNALLLTAHLGNWEAINRALALEGFPMGTVYRAANNTLVDTFIKRLRGQTGGVQIAKGTNGARSLFKLAKEAKMPLGFLNDQKLNNGIAVPFLGQTAMTAPALAEMARRFQRPVLAIFCTREIGKWGRVHFNISLSAPLALQETGKAEADVLANTTLFNQVMEAEIHKMPAQWLWAHKRF